MASSTVLELAKEMKVTASELLRQLKSAGIEKHSETDGESAQNYAHAQGNDNGEAGRRPAHC